MDEDTIGQKLDTIATILKLAHKEELDTIRSDVRSDPGKAAILDASLQWIAAGSLTKGVAQEIKRTERSIRNYISELLNLGVLAKRGAGRSVEYRSTGII